MLPGKGNCREFCSYTSLGSTVGILVSSHSRGVGKVGIPNPGIVTSVSPPHSDIYLMEKELAKEQERNNRHRPPKILEPPAFQEPPPKVGKGQSPPWGTRVGFPGLDAEEFPAFFPVPTAQQAHVQAAIPEQPPGSQAAIPGENSRGRGIPQGSGPRG